MNKFQFEKADGSFRFFVDCICTCWVMAWAVLIWRDLWTLIHLNLMPEDLLLSGCVSLVSCGGRNVALGN